MTTTPAEADGAGSPAPRTLRPLPVGRRGARQPEVEQDGYVRLTARTLPLEHITVPTRPRNLLFVDLDCDAAQAPVTLDRLREVTTAMFLDTRAVLVRAPADADSDHLQALAERLDGLAADMGLPAQHLGVVATGFGEPTTARWTGTPPLDQGEALRRARAVELHAVLTDGRGVWAPTGHHFRVPNGQHSDVFIRLADAFRSERDAVALATWVAPALTPNLGLVLDTRGLTPLALGLRVLAATQGHQLGPVTYLERYPITALETGKAIRDALGGQNGLLAVLSLSSKGGVLRQLHRSLKDEAVPGAIQVLGDRSRPNGPGEAVDPSDSGLGGLPRVDVWLGLGQYGTPVDETECSTCRDPDRAPLLRVDPGDLGGLALPEPTLVTPNINDAQRNARLWEACDRLGAVMLEGTPDITAAAHRPKRANSNGMAVKVDLPTLVADTDFRDDIVALLHADLEDSRAGRGTIGLAGPPHEWLGTPDTVVIPAHELGWPGADDLVRRLSAELDTPDPVIVPLDIHKDQPSAEDLAKIQAAGRILLLNFGLVSGLSLQRALLVVQNARRRTATYDLAGLVVHARPAAEREWTTLRNSLGFNLHAVFDMVLPTGGPLSDESTLLDGLPPPDSPELDAFIAGRRAVTAGTADPVADGYVPVLWGAPSTPELRTRVRQHSLFGHELQLPALFAAVGASVHRRRVTTKGAGWYAFEMPAIVSSYYDALIIACMLRWLEPHEVWWGRRESEAEQTVHAILQRATDEDLYILLPEMLLAVHQGKIPPRGARPLINHAQASVNAPGEWPPEARHALTLALDLAKQAL